MTSKRLYALFISICCVTGAVAQDLPSDLELWRGLELEYELSDDWDLEFEEQFRLNENISSMKEFFLEAGLQYKATDFLDFKLQYRYSNMQKARNERRFAFDTNLEYDIPDIPIDIGYRFRIQNAKVFWTERKINYLRNKLSLDANLSKLVDPFLSVEHFYRLRRYEESEPRTLRYTIGLQWRIEGDLELETYFRRDHERNVSTPNLQYIIGAMIKYELN